MPDRSVRPGHAGCARLPGTAVMLGSFLFWLARRLAEPPAVGPPPYAAFLLPEQLHLDEVYREVKYTYDLQLRRIDLLNVCTTWMATTGAFLFRPIRPPVPSASRRPAAPHDQRELHHLIQQRQPAPAVVGHPEGAATTPATLPIRLEPPLRRRARAPASSCHLRAPTPKLLTQDVLTEESRCRRAGKVQRVDHERCRPPGRFHYSSTSS